MWPSSPGPSADRQRQRRSPSTIVPGPQAGRVLVDLHDDLVAVEAHDLAQQRARADAHRLAQRERAVARSRAAPGR